MNKSFYFIIALIIVITGILWRTTHHKKNIIAPTETIVVGVNAEFPPFTFKKDGAIVGFDIDIITEVMKRMDKTMEIIDMPSFDVLIPGLQRNDFQVIAAGLTPTEERAKLVLFTKPYLMGDMLAIIALTQTPPIKNIHDLYGKRVVVSEGYTADIFISQYKESINITRLGSSSAFDLILALQTDSADACISALHPLKPYFDKFGREKFQIVPIEGTQESCAFAISKFQPELRDYMQVTLDAMEEDGTLQQIRKKWGLA